jgi:hypothetical protein
VVVASEQSYYELIKKLEEWNEEIKAAKLIQINVIFIGKI